MAKIRSVFTHLAALLFLVTLTSCERNTTKSINTDSSKFATLDEKKKFLERYVKFRRSYEALEFHITYTDGGKGRLPSPTEWDIRIAAKVPADEIDHWTAGLKTAQGVATDWVSDIPKAPTKLDAFEWFTDGQRFVSVNRKERILVYRNHSQ